MGMCLPGLGQLDPFKVDLPQRQTSPKAAEVLTEGFPRSAGNPHQLSQVQHVHMHLCLCVTEEKQCSVFFKPIFKFRCSLRLFTTLIQMD